MGEWKTTAYLCVKFVKKAIYIINWAYELGNGICLNSSKHFICNLNCLEFDNNNLSVRKCILRV